MRKFYLTKNQIICSGDVKKGLTLDADSSVSRKALQKKKKDKDDKERKRKFSDPLAIGFLSMLEFYSNKGG